MQSYRVVECRADQGRISLQCGHGRYHTARTLNMVPRAGVALHGARPHLGFGILLCPQSGTIYRVIFEAVNGACPELEPPAVAHALHFRRDEGHAAQGQAD